MSCLNRLIVWVRGINTLLTNVTATLKCA